MEHTGNPNPRGSLATAQSLSVLSCTLSPLCFRIDIEIRKEFLSFWSYDVNLLKDIVTALQMERFATTATASTVVTTVNMRSKDTKPSR